MKKLRAHLELLPLAKELVSIRCSLDLGIRVEDLQLHSQDPGELARLYTELEFKSWLGDTRFAGKRVGRIQ